MAFGKIYESSWWGTAHINNIGFGSIYANLADTFILNFKNRVLADGGTFEAENCVRIEIDRIQDI